MWHWLPTQELQLSNHEQDSDLRLSSKISFLIAKVGITTDLSPEPVLEPNEMMAVYVFCILGSALQMGVWSCP